MTVVLIGDVGPIDGMYHAGDEAMLQALVDELRKRGFASFTVVSGNPAHSRIAFGTGSIHRIGFGAGTTRNRSEREARLAAVIAAASGAPGALDWQDPAWAVIEAVAASTGVVIAGGGNLSSTWPEHLYERCAISAVAEVFRKPLVVASQTIGPALLGRDGELLAELLTRASLVGLREESSYALAERLGVDLSRTRRTYDDAMFLVGDDRDGGKSVSYCAVTISPDSGLASAEIHRAQVARFLDIVVDNTGLEIVFLPHFGAERPEEGSGDADIHSEIAELMKSPGISHLPVLSARQIASVTRQASLCISTRYHPVVFAASGGVPSIGISVDDYTAAKISGAQANAGMSDWSIPLVSLPAGSATAVLKETWTRRVEIREHLLARAAQARTDAEGWWDEVESILRGSQRPSTPPTGTTGLALIDAAAAMANAGLTAWSDSESARFHGARLWWESEQETIDQLRLDIEEAERSVGEVNYELATAVQRAQEADVAASAAYDLLGVIGEPLYERTLIAHAPLGAAIELNALLNTRTFRWTRRARAIYGALLRQTRRLDH